MKNDVFESGEKYFLRKNSMKKNEHNTFYINIQK